MKTYTEFCELVNSYKKAFKKCNVNASVLCDLQNNYVITETITYKEGRKVSSRETKVISTEYFGNVLTAALFFNDRIEKAYTIAGYIPVKLTAVSPDKKTRVIREYTYTCK
jgi:hypothetical protein